MSSATANPDARKKSTMSQDSPQSTVYELRRQQRGAEPPQKAGSWKRKLALTSALVAAAAVLGVVLYVRWSLTHVRMTGVHVWADVRKVASDQDGRVKELLVRPKDTVKAGDVLMRLDDSELQARLTAAQAQADSRSSLYDQAQANLRVTEATIDANIQDAKLGVAAAQAGLSRAQAQQSEAQAQLDKLMAGARTEDVQAAEARLATARALQDLYALEVTQSEQLVTEGIDSAHMLQVKKTQLTTQKNAVKEAELALARLKAGPTDEDKRIAQQQVAAREADLSLAKAQLEQAQSELDRADAMKARVDLGQAQVAAAKADLDSARADVKAARDALNQTNIVSKVDGTVISTHCKVGEFCRKGDVAILVSDDSSGRWIEGFVSERDAARVKPGQKADVEVVVGSGQTTEAAVAAVSPATNSLRQASTGSAADPSVGAAEQVWVKLRLLKQDARWLPGNSAKAVIITE